MAESWGVEKQKGTCSAGGLSWGAVNTLLLDVDGTLINSYPGIRAGFVASMEAIDHPLPSEDFLRGVSGPPITESYAKLGLDAARTSQAVAAFRTYYEETGWEECTLFPGWEDTLRQWRAAGFRLCTATSKGQGTAAKMLDYLGVAELFDFIGGADYGAGRDTKSAVIGHVLDWIRTMEQDPPQAQTVTQTVAHQPAAKCLMVGDRYHDVEGANDYGIPTVLVRWGHARPQEFAQAAAVADDIEALKGIVHAHFNQPHHN